MLVWVITRREYLKRMFAPAWREGGAIQRIAHARQAKRRGQIILDYTVGE